MKISEIITDKYKLRISPTVYYDLLADVVAAEEDQESGSENPNNCEDAISRQAAQDYIAEYLSQYLYNDVREAVEVIDEYIGELPSVTPKPKMGRWIYQEGYVPYKWKCNQCSSEFKTDFNYCPSCGAKMSENPTGSESEEEIGPDKKG